jgi:ATP-dependent exoDNAse (exonuclease V) beta subunit
MRAVGLTAEQEEAVARRSEPLILSAGAGSGKTSVLVERFVRAVCEERIAPARILAITFTERAAGELRARVRARLLELGEREAARDTEAAFVGTFHAFCARLLRAHARAAGVDPGYAILDEGLAAGVRERAFTAALRELLDEEGAPAVDLLAAYEHERLRRMIEGVHLALRSRGQRLPRLPAARPGSEELQLEAARALGLIDALLHAFGEHYEQLKRAREALDFDDLELLAGELLERDAATRRAWSERFELLMVDEFQDTNPRQLAILEALDRDNLFTVGDELQSIYGFRHADVRLFRARREQLAPQRRALALRSNFRSRPELLAVVNGVFGARFEAFEPLVAERAGAANGPRVELLLSATRGWEQAPELTARNALDMPPAAPWRHAEARLLAQRIAELVDSGEALAGEVAVLLRAGGDLHVYERAIALQGLPTLAAAGGFWSQQQTGDLLAYLRALANPLDEVALYSALASPLAGCSSDTLAVLAEDARAASRSAWETALLAQHEEPLLARLEGGRRAALVSFCALLERERLGARRRTISQLIERAIDACGYERHVLALQWGERRLANVRKLQRLARRFEAGEGRDLRGFLDHVAQLAAASAAEPDAPVAGEQDAVRLMTVHAAKGLEFPVVCLADLGRAANNRMPYLLVDGERVGLRLARLDGEKATPTLDYEQLAAERAVAEAEEEARIVYVAMTRARERLLMSGAVDFERWPDPLAGASAISWLGPALAAGLPALTAAATAGHHEVPSGLGGCVRVRLNAPSMADASGPGGGEEAQRPRTPGAAADGGARAEPSATSAGAAAVAGLQAGGDVAGAAASRSSAGAPRTTRAPVSAPGVGAFAQPASLSYSSLSQLERCGYRYYLERVLGLPEAPVPLAQRGAGLEPRARGTLVHSLLESLDFARVKLPSRREIAAHAVALSMRVSPEDADAIARTLALACESPLAARLAAARVRREHPFAFALGEQRPLLSGVIDVLAHEPDGGVLVVDYKSDRLEPHEEVHEIVERDYGLQRLLYALAVLRSGAARVEVAHWFLQRPQEWAASCFEVHERAELEGQLTARVDAALAGSFAVSSDPHRALCLTCPGRAALCRYSERQTLREHALESRE